MNYATVCSGIEAPSMAWHCMNWNPLFFSEIEPFPCAALKHHYPDVPNHGDMKKFKEWPDYDLTDGLICGGTPCQSFSVAGLRKGLDDPRGNLTLTFLAILARYRPRWVVWENVPGVLSDKTGAFGALLGGLGQLGYGFAYRILDAQYFGVPQRRRRVFVVGYFGDWRRAASVLFERHSLQGHNPPCREAGKGFAADLAPSLTSSGRGVERTGESRGQDPVIAIDCRNGKENSITGTLQSHGQSYSLNTLPVVCGTPDSGSGKRRGAGIPPESLVPDVAGSLQERDAKGADSDTKPGHLIPFAIAENQRGEVREMDQCPSLSVGGGKPGRGYPAIAFKAGQGAGARSLGLAEELSPTLPSSDSGSNRAPTVATMIHGTQDPCVSDIAFALGRNSGQENVYGVRRLTPRECERLQGFPDDYTLVPYRGKPAADGPRYKALGNTMAVPVVRWIGKRIEEANKL